MVAVVLLADRHLTRVEVLQRSPVTAILLDVVDVHLVDEAMLTFGSHLRLGGVRLVGAHVVLIEGVEHGLHTSLDLCRVIAGTVTGQEELQHESRHVGALLDPMQQILAHYLTVERRRESLIQGIHGYTA
ncbi:hypothetical protein D9M71_108980 [compost metagenome]